MVWIRCCSLPELWFTRWIGSDGRFWSCWLCFTSVWTGNLCTLIYRSGMVNSNTVTSKFHLIWSYCEIFFYHFPNISCLKCTVNLNFHLIRSKTLLTNDFKLTVPNLYLHFMDTFWKCCVSLFEIFYICWLSLKMIIVMCECIPKRIHQTQTGWLSLVNWEHFLKMGYYIRGTCILMRWPDSLDIENGLGDLGKRVQTWYLRVSCTLKGWTHQASSINIPLQCIVTLQNGFPSITIDMH